MNNTIKDIARETEALLKTSEMCGAEAVRVTALCKKLEEQKITVSVIGQFKRGKSTLVNAILEEKLLPVGIVPVTSAVTIVQYGEKSATVYFDNGTNRVIELEALHEYINEGENPNNKLGVSYVKLHTTSPFLKGGLTFVDTPGVGSAHKHNSDAAYAFIKESDAVIFMLSVDSPINEIEIEFLRNAKEYAAKFYFAVNKIDTVSEDELSAYLNYCRKLLCKLMEVNKITMFPVSAKHGTGLFDLKDVIQNDCKTSVKEILEGSVRMKLYDTIGSALSQLGLYWNAMKMPIGRFDNRFTKMEKSFSDLQEKREDLLLQLNADSEGLINDLKEELDFKGSRLGKVEAGKLQKKLTEIYKQGLENLNDGCFELSTGLEANLNEMKQYLSSSVSELFNMEYHYNMTELNLSASGTNENSGNSTELNFINNILDQDADFVRDNVEKIINDIYLNYKMRIENSVKDLSEKFTNETKLLCDELDITLRRILLYREENSITVAYKIDELNKLTKQLKKLRAMLEVDNENKV